MRIELLGTGGATTIPRPGCNCQICLVAKKRGIPYSRTGPSLFVHGPNVLIDTPEEIGIQLSRSQIGEVKACFYSHWHPDHVMGRRVWEALNQNWRRELLQKKTTIIYLPQQVGLDFRKNLGTWEHLTYFAERRIVELKELTDGDTVTLGDTLIRPLRLAQSYAYAFMFEGQGKRVLIVPDELKGWNPPLEARGVDLAVVPMGIVEVSPLTGERRIPEAHKLHKATYEEMLEIVRTIQARRAVITHIEESYGLGYNDLQGIEKQLQGEGLNISFAYDTMLVSP
jgi:phosphoribosyl 1,2-cyclic phosphate phosphodiesterase